MKKFIGIAMLAFVSAFATAGDMKSSEQSPRFSSHATSSASEAPADAAAPTALENGAAKIGSLVGGMFKAPMMLGKAFGSGLKAGVTGSDHSVSKNPVNSTSSTTPKLDQASFNPMLTAFGMPLKVLVRRAQKDKSEPLAPIEERSSIASTMF